MSNIIRTPAITTYNLKDLKEIFLTNTFLTCEGKFKNQKFDEIITGVLELYDEESGMIKLSFYRGNDYPAYKTVLLSEDDYEVEAEFCGLSLILSIISKETGNKIYSNLLFICSDYIS